MRTNAYCDPATPSGMRHTVCYLLLLTLPVLIPMRVLVLNSVEMRGIRWFRWERIGVEGVVGRKAAASLREGVLQGVHVESAEILLTREVGLRLVGVAVVLNGG